MSNDIGNFDKESFYGSGRLVLKQIDRYKFAGGKMNIKNEEGVKFYINIPLKGGRFLKILLVEDHNHCLRA